MFLCLERIIALRSPAQYLVPSAKEGKGEISMNTLVQGSGQIAVMEGRDGLAGLRDLVVAVVVCHIMT